MVEVFFLFRPYRTGLVSLIFLQTFRAAGMGLFNWKLQIQNLKLERTCGF